MLKDHRKDLHDFRMEEAATYDPDLEDFCLDGMKLIAGHLRTAYTLAKANGIAVAKPTPPSK